MATRESTTMYIPPMKHYLMAVHAPNGDRLAVLYDSQSEFQNAAQNIRIRKELTGWKELSFTLNKYNAYGEENPFLDFIKNENHLHIWEDDVEDVYLIKSPTLSHSSSSMDVTVNCYHISEELKAKNLYGYFDDTNGINTCDKLAELALAGTGWTISSCDTFYESDGSTVKVRSYSCDTKTGAYTMLSEICDLFKAHPIFDGANRTVQIVANDNYTGVMELLFGKNVDKISRTLASDSLVTRLYVEGEYGDFGFVGIEDAQVDGEDYGLPFILNFDYYDEIGVLTQEQKDAIEAYKGDYKEVIANISENAGQLLEKNAELIELIGVAGYVFVDGDVTYIGGTFADDSEKTINDGDRIALFTQPSASMVERAEYSYTTYNSALTYDVPYIKFVPTITGKIAAYEDMAVATNDQEAELFAKMNRYLRHNGYPEINDKQTLHNVYGENLRINDDTQNLLRYSNELDHGTPYSGWGADVTFSTDEEGYSVVTIPAAGEWRSYNLRMPDIAPDDLAGQKVTLSAWLKSDELASAPSKFSVGIAGFNENNTRTVYCTERLSTAGFNGIKIDGEWCYIWKTFTLPDDLTSGSGDIHHYGVQFYTASNNTTSALMMKKPKLERGEVPTPYSLAPADITGDESIAAPYNQPTMLTYVTAIGASDYNESEYRRMAETGMYDAMQLMRQVTHYEEQVAQYQSEQTDIEETFNNAMGSLLRDGYWSDDNYVDGQQTSLYLDALEISNHVSKPTVSYNISVNDLSVLDKYKDEKLLLGMSVRVYDELLPLNDYAIVTETTEYPDKPQNNTVALKTDLLDLGNKTFSTVIERITDLSNQVKQGKDVYERAAAISKDGTIQSALLEGAIDVLKTKLISTSSNWRTDDLGNIILTSLDGNSAMMLCGSGFMIASSKKEDGTWNWRTFGTGEGFTADLITAGFLNADRIEAGSITTNHLSSEVGSTLNLSSNTSIDMRIEKVAGNTVEFMLNDKEIIAHIKDETGVTALESTVTQTAGKIDMVVADGSTSSNVQLTPGAYTAIANNITLSGDRVTITSGDDTITVQEGIDLTARKVTEYTEKVDEITDPTKSVSGTFIDVTDSADAPLAGFTLYGKTETETDASARTGLKPVSLGEDGDVVISIGDGTTTTKTVPIPFDQNAGLAGFKTDGTSADGVTNWTDDDSNHWQGDMLNLKDNVLTRYVQNVFADTGMSWTRNTTDGHAWFKATGALQREAYPTNDTASGTATGNPAHITDSIGGSNITALSANIEQVQSGSGDPSPSNIRPITGWTGAKLFVSDEEPVLGDGRNLLAISDMAITLPLTQHAINYTYGGDGWVNAAANAISTTGNFITTFWGYNTATAYIGAGTYTLTIEDDGVLSDETGATIRVQVYGSGLSGGGTGGTSGRYFQTAGAYSLIVSGHIQRIGLYYLAGTNGKALDGRIRIKLERGDTSTDWCPAPEDLATPVNVSFGQTVYGGTLDATAGTVTVTRQVDTFDGSSDEAWTLQTWSYSRRYFRVTTSSSYKNVTHGIDGVTANWLPAISDAQDGSYTLSSLRLRSSSTASNYLFLLLGTDIPNVTTVAELRAYLAANPLQVSYPVATPTTLTVTPTTIQTSVGENYIWSDTGDVTVGYYSSSSNNTAISRTLTASSVNTVKTTDYAFALDGYDVYISLAAGSSSDDLQAFLSAPATQVDIKYLMKSGYSTNCTVAQINAMKKLASLEGTTVISNDANVNMDVEYFVTDLAVAQNLSRLEQRVNINESNIALTDEKISLAVSTATSNAAGLVSEATTALQLYSDSIVATLDKKVEENSSELHQYVRWDENGVEVGKEGSAYVTRTTNEGYEVLENGTPISTMERGVVESPILRVVYQLEIGDYSVRGYSDGGVIWV